MAKFCLTIDTKEKFKRALKSGEINPFKMADLSSEDRRNFLEKYVGKENAVQVNANFESKLLLKNQKRGYLTWAKNLITGASPEIKRDLISRIERMENVLDAPNEQAFLEDLAAERLKIGVTQTEAKSIVDLSKKLSDLRTKFDTKTSSWSSEADANLYGATQVALENYIGELKEGKKTIKGAISNRMADFKGDYSTNAARALGKLVLDTAKGIADTSVSLVASFDDSLFGRQGIMNLLSGHPGIWGRNFIRSFGDIIKTFGGEKTTQTLRAKLYSDPLYLNGEYQKAKIVDLSTEQYPTSLPAQVPVLGKFFEASEAAFENGSLRMRTELYKQLRQIKIDHKIALSDEEVKGMGKVINSLGAKGDLGRAGDNPVVRLLMWAPKMLKADLDILTAHSFSDIPKSDRVTARWNLAKIVGATILINTIAQINNKDSVEFDPRSSDFLQLGGRFGYLRGIPAIITLMARLATGEYKTKTGEIAKYEPGIGKRSELDAVYSFLRGKAPPATGAIYDKLAESDFNGNPPTFTSTLLGKAVPISIQNLVKLYKDQTIDNTFGVIGDFFGLNANLTPDPNIKSKVIPEGKKVSNEDVISYAMIYAKAVGTDPETAFNRIFTGQKIRKVENGTVIVERMSLADSTAVKKKGKANNPTMKLDHTVPLELGGSNDESNLKLITTSRWSSYTAVENALGKALKDGKISKDEAQKTIKEFKSIDDSAYFKSRKEDLLNKYK